MENHSNPDEGEHISLSLENNRFSFTRELFLLLLTCTTTIKHERPYTAEKQKTFQSIQQNYISTMVGCTIRIMA